MNKVHLQARCMKSMQAVRVKSVSPTSRGLRLPLSPSHGVKLLTSHKMMRKIEKKVVKEATRKKWVEKFPWIEWTGCMVLNQLHKKVSQIEIGRLEENFSCGRTEGFSNPLKFPGYELFTLFIKCARWLRKRG